MKYCSVCGTEAPDSALHCDYCDNMFEFPKEPGQKVRDGQKRENIPAGIVGALVGAVIGAACIILVSRMGVVSSFCGLALAFCTLMGYELLAGSMSTGGALICVGIMLATPYFADRVDWAIVLMRDYRQQYGEALPLMVGYRMVPDMIREDIIPVADYIGNLVKLYVFTVIGGVVTAIKAFRK